MPNINDFKLISQKSEKYFNLLSKALEVDLKNTNSKLKERLGFYIYMLENICGVKDVLDLAEMITDTEFNSLIFNKKFNDYGVDAVQIDGDELKINLFNFKYREKFSLDKKQSMNETILSTKFINALISEDVNNLEGKVKEQAQVILDKLNSNEIWKLQLYVISNEFFELEAKDDNLQRLEKVYGLEIIPIGLSKISQIMSIRPEPVNAELIIDTDAILSFSESSISSSRSYIVRLPINEIVRITCDKKEYREKYNIEDLSPLSQVDLDFSVLFDNVRGLVLRSKFNKNISKTLKEEPSRFFMYNNGLTLTAQDINAVTVNANKRVKLTIKSFQVLNGGQTLRTIHAFNKADKENIEKYLSDSEILVRIFKTTTDNELINKIAEYTNSQNSISNIDLKSLRSEQIQLEQYLDDHNIIYARKTGDTGLSEHRLYDYKISMERYGQVLFAINGFPEKTSNLKRQIFDKYYDDLFGEGNLDISDSPKNVARYFKIKKAYENNSKEYKSSEQKVFYVLYIDRHIEKAVDELIDLFEDIIKQYNRVSGKDIPEARQLIQVKFKEFLDNKLDIKNVSYFNK